MSQRVAVYSCNFQVRSYEVDQSGQITLPSIANYFQEAAGQHATQLGIDIGDLKVLGLTWVVFKLQIHVDRFPSRWEDLTVKTWTSIQGSLRAYRDYQLLDQDEKVVATGLSHWMMLDGKTRRPVKIPDAFHELPLKDDLRAMVPHKGKVSLASPAKPELVARAGANDTDLNGHVNNVSYIHWVTNQNMQTGGEVLKCNNLTIQYMAEAVAGDEIFLSEESQERKKIISLYKNGTEQPLASAETEWSHLS